jgi:hypothetical protein
LGHEEEEEEIWVGCPEKISNIPLEERIITNSVILLEFSSLWNLLLSIEHIYCVITNVGPKWVSNETI